MRYFDKRTVIRACVLTFLLKNHCPFAFGADHLTVSWIMRASVSITGPAACNRYVNNLVWGPLDHEPHFFAQCTCLEEMQLRSHQVVRVQMQILTLAQCDHGDVTLLRQIFPILPNNHEDAEAQKNCAKRPYGPKHIPISV